MSITSVTIKKLFSLTGNQCAYTDCENMIIEDGVVVGEICHIEAKSKNGPRHNSKLKIDQIDGPDNLLILCSKHHKIIDTKVDEHPVDLLQKMKKEHEFKFNGSTDQDLSENEINEFKKQIIIDVKNENVGTAITVGSNEGNLHIHQGMNVGEIETVFKILMENNLPHLLAEAKETADKRISEFQGKVLSSIEQNSGNIDVGRLADPVVQGIIVNAQKAVVLNSEGWAPDALASLVKQAIEKDAEDFRKYIANEASQVIGGLWEELLKILAFKLSIENINFTEIKSRDQLYSRLEDYYENLINYEVSNHKVNYLTTKKCFNFRGISRKGIPASRLAETYQDVFEGSDVKFIEGIVKKENEFTNELFKKWEDTGLGSYTLTPVGFAVALSYLHQINPDTKAIKFEEIIK